MPPLLPRSSFYRKAEGERGLGAGSMMVNHHPPPPILDDRALTLMLSRATRLHYLPCAMHATYVAKDKRVVGRVN